MEKLTKSEEWFHNNVIEDLDDINAIGELAIKQVDRLFNVKFKTVAAPIAVYAVIMDCIKRYLHSKEAKNSSYSINIADRLEIGFTSGFETEDDDAEKGGNFCIYLKHIPNDAVTASDPDEKNAIALAVQWQAANIHKSADDLKAIAGDGLNKLRQELDIFLGNPELVIPIFAAVHSQVIAYIQFKKSAAGVDVDDISFNMAGLYEIGIIEEADGENTIQFKPLVSDKGTFKSDEKATSKFE